MADFITLFFLIGSILGLYFLFVYLMEAKRTKLAFTALIIGGTIVGRVGHALAVYLLS